MSNNDDLAESARVAADSLAAVGQHGGWAISEAVSRCAEAWTRELTGSRAACRSASDWDSVLSGHGSAAFAGTSPWPASGLRR